MPWSLPGSENTDAAAVNAGNLNLMVMGRVELAQDNADRPAPARDVDQFHAHVIELGQGPAGSPLTAVRNCLPALQLLRGAKEQHLVPGIKDRVGAGQGNHMSLALNAHHRAPKATAQTRVRRFVYPGNPRDPGERNRSHA
jgi:hypothetical protein